MVTRLFTLTAMILLFTGVLSMKITDETNHEILIDQPDSIDAVRESEIHDDENHNVDLADQETDIDDELDTEIDLIEEEIVPEVSSYYDATNNEYVEEVTDPQGRFRSKKVVKEGPGFKSVTIMSSSSGGSINIEGNSGPSADSIINQMMNDIFGGKDPSQQPPSSGDTPTQATEDGIINQLGRIMENMQRQQMAMMSSMFNDAIQQQADGQNNQNALVPSYKKSFLGQEEEEEVKAEEDSDKEKQSNDGESSTTDDLKVAKVKAGIPQAYILAMAMLSLLFIILVVFIISCKMNGKKKRSTETEPYNNSSSSSSNTDYQNNSVQVNIQSSGYDHQSHLQETIVEERRKKGLGKSD